MSYERDLMPANPTSPPPLAVRRALRDVGGHVQAWRKLRGLTQNQLADRAGVDRKTLMRVERGDGGVSLEIVLRVLHGLGILDSVPTAVDPYETDVGRLRADDQLPRRVRPRDVR
jgi:transcriptional regulator with XRE-family HTH domain